MDEDEKTINYALTPQDIRLQCLHLAVSNNRANADLILADARKFEAFVSGSDAG